MLPYPAKDSISSARWGGVWVMVWLLPYAAWGQALRFEHLTREDGLSENSIQAMVQDQTGFLWIGTVNGLNRYDGSGFKVYVNDADNPHSLSDNWIQALHEDETGMLWIGTASGGLSRFDPTTERFTRYQSNSSAPQSLHSNSILAVYADSEGMVWAGTHGGGLKRLNPQTGQFTSYQHDPDDPYSLSNNWVRVIYEDTRGTLWVGTAEGGLNQLDQETGRFTRYQHDPNDVSSLSSNSVRSILEDHTGSLWVGTQEGLNRLDQTTGRFMRYTHDANDARGLSHNFVRCLYEDQRGVLYVGTDGGGVNRWDAETGQFTHYKNFLSDPYSLNNNSVWSILEDRSGILWVATSGGLNRFDPSTDRFTRYANDPSDVNSLRNSGIWSVWEDRLDRLWVGTDGGGLSWLDPSTGKFQHYQHDPNDPSSLTNNYVRAILEDRQGRLWVGTDGGGLSWLDRTTGRFQHYQHDPGNPHSLSSNAIRSIYEDRQGALWVGTAGSGLNHFDAKTSQFTRYQHDPNNPYSLSNNSIWSVLEDEKGTLWVGTNGGGVNRWDAETGQFIRYLNDPDDPSSLAGNSVLTMLEDHAGTLWVGAAGGGLNRLNAATGTFTHYHPKDGLPNDVVYGILEDQQHNLWVSTNLGLSRFNPRTEAFQNYDVTNGLPGNEFNSGAYFGSSSGRLYFGGMNGLAAFYPDSLKTNPHVPPVVLTSFRKYNREVALETSITFLPTLELSYEDDMISFEVAALDFRAPKKNQYVYKLDGFNEAWVALGNGDAITFTDLDPGPYTLQVKGSNNDGIWNEAGLALPIYVTPPFWQTWWFRILSIGSMLGVLYGAYRVRLQSVTEQNRMLEQEIRERKRAEDRLETQNAELEAKNAELERYTYTVSHDLKNPLVTIRGFAGFLRQDIAQGDLERIKVDLEHIENATENMYRLLEDLLALSRVGRVINDSKMISLNTLVEEVVTTFFKQHIARGINIDIQEAIPMVWGDRSRLLEVFQNLIGNAIKFIGTGPQLRIEIGGYVDKQIIGAQVVCFVRDNGIGIDPAYAEKIFGLFERLEPEVDGTGIGLTLVKQIVEVHGGRIWVESEGKGQGSTFFFTLPQGPALSQ